MEYYPMGLGHPIFFSRSNLKFWLLWYHGTNYSNCALYYCPQDLEKDDWWGRIPVESRFGAGTEDWGIAVKGLLDSPVPAWWEEFSPVSLFWDEVGWLHMDVLECLFLGVCRRLAPPTEASPSPVKRRFLIMYLLFWWTSDHLTCRLS